MRTTSAAFLALGILASGSSHAAFIVWDQSVGATGGSAYGLYSNNTNGVNGGPNFAEPVMFDDAVTLSGMDIYTGTIVDAAHNVYQYGMVGTPVVIRLRTGSATGPIIDFHSTISLRDFDGAATTPIVNAPALNVGTWFRVHADLPKPVRLDPGTTYWIGMAGDGYWPGGDAVDLGIGTMFGAEGPLLQDSMARYSGMQFDYMVNSAGNSQFRLWGEEHASVPEPGTLALFTTGLMCAIVISRRRRQRETKSI